MSNSEIRLQYFCICHGLQEELYLKHLERLLKTDTRRVIFSTTQGQPGKISKHKGIKYSKAILFDHDGDAEAFKKALGVCIKEKCSNAYSNRNFDLWLLLHKQNFSSHVDTNHAYITHIRKAYGLDNEANIKNRKIQEKILNQIALDDVKAAIHRAEQIRKNKLQTDAEQIGKILFYDNPDLSIHQFISQVFSECGETAE